MCGTSQPKFRNVARSNVIVDSHDSSDSDVEIVPVDGSRSHSVVTLPTLNRNVGSAPAPRAVPLPAGSKSNTMKQLPRLPPPAPPMPPPAPPRAPQASQPSARPSQLSGRTMLPPPVGQPLHSKMQPSTSRAAVRAGGGGPSLPLPNRPRTHFERTHENWAELHTPKDIKEVALAPKKIEEVDSWLVSALECRAQALAKVEQRAAQRQWAAISPPQPAVRAATDEDLDAMDPGLLDALLTGEPGPVLAHSQSYPSTVPASMSLHEQGDGQGEPGVQPAQARLLIFTGPPGVGKSTAVQLLCSQRRLPVSSWREADGARSVSASSFGTGAASAATMGQAHSAAAKGTELNADTLHRVLARVYLGSRGDDEDDRALRSAVSAQGISPASGSGDMGEGVASKVSAAVDAAVQPLAAYLSGRGHNGVRAAKVLMVEELPRPSGLGTGGRGGGDRAKAVAWKQALCKLFLSVLEAVYPGPPVILVVSEGEEPGEPVCKPALVRLLGTEVVDHPATTLVEVGRIPDGRMKKALELIAERQHLPRFLPSPVSTAGYAVPPAELSHVIADIVTSARGDLRHAIMTLQLVAEQRVHRKAAVAPSASLPAVKAGSKRTAKQAGLSVNQGDGGGSAGPAPKRRGRNIDADSGDAFTGAATGTASSAPVSALKACGRDDFYEVLHTFGKLLYAKRDTACGWEYAPQSMPAWVGGGQTVAWPAAKAKLEYDPDALVSGCAYDTSALLCFLLENCPPFFSSSPEDDSASGTGLTDLVQTLDCYSRADVLLAWDDRGSNTHGMVRSGAFPEAHAAAIASRAVSTHNNHPAPPSFRPIRKPVLYGLEKARHANEHWLVEEHLGAGPDLASAMTGTEPFMATNGAGATSPFLAVLSAKERATDVVPALGLMSSASRAASSQGRAASSTQRSQAADGAAWVHETGLTRRAEALVTAACQFGMFQKSNAQGEVVSTLGSGISSRTWLAQPSPQGSMARTPSAGTEGTLPEDDGVTRRVDEDAEGDDDGDAADAVRSLPLSTAMLGQDTVRLSAGLVLGMWEASAARRGVNVRRLPLPYESLPAGTPGQQAGLVHVGHGEGIVEDDIDE